MSKFVRIAAALVICSAAAGASAQEAAPAPESPVAPMVTRTAAGPQNTLTVNPLSLVVGMVSLEYERVTSENLSVFVAPSYWSLGVGAGDDEFSFSAYGLGLGVRYFMTGMAPEGFWVAPSLELAFASAKYAGAEGSSVGYGVGGQFGYTWLIGDVFDISLGLGAAYSNNEVEVEYEEAGIASTRADGFSGVLPTLRFAIGAAF